MLNEENILKYLKDNFNKDLDSASDEMIHDSISYLVSEEVKNKARVTIENNKEQKMIHYVSIEFLLGNILVNNLNSMGKYDSLARLLKKHNKDLNKIVLVENDAGLGNGGLGRLAACFLESLATLNYKAMGHTLYYRYGLFKQSIENGEQRESMDEWLSKGHVWLDEKVDKKVKIEFSGNLEEFVDYNGVYHYKIVDPVVVWAIPYDIVTTGYKLEGNAYLRLWKASYEYNPNLSKERNEEIEKEVNYINDYLYPSDHDDYGKILRLKQEYLLSSACIQNIVNEYLETGHKLKHLPRYIALHLNDTHPVFSIVELLRVLLDNYYLSWDEAFKIVCDTVSYTNHTVLSESLEVQYFWMVQKYMPRIASLLLELDRRLRSYLKELNYDNTIIERMAIINGGKVYMTNLALYCAKSVNGVSKIHSDILKNDLLNDFYNLYPNKFINVTNGVSPREWISDCNKELDKFISKRVGKEYHTDCSLLKGLSKYASDKETLDELAKIKLNNKKRFATYLKESQNIIINPEARIDVQAKRIHEYKRQLLNVLRIIYLYSEIKLHPTWDMTPQTFVFAGKAASSYYMAKRIIHLINKLAKHIDNDEIASKKMKVVFVENFNVTVSKILTPATDVSQQISLVGKEASGTGNMKAIFNGALMVDTRDGANLEIMEKCGVDNSFDFGLTNEERLKIEEIGYDPRKYYNEDERIRRVIDLLNTGFDGESFYDIADYLLHNGRNRDIYMCLADFDDYLRADALMDMTYRNKEEWFRKTLLSISRNYYFSSDRSIKEYAKKVWKL